MSRHPLCRFREQQYITLQDLAIDIDINPSALHHPEYNRGRKVTLRIISWCKKQSVDPAIFYPDA